MSKITDQQDNISEINNIDSKYQKALQKFNKFPESKNARELAFTVLYQVYTLNAFSDIAINRTYNNSKLNEQEKSTATAFILGTINETFSLDNIIKKLSKTKINKLDLRVLVILRLGLWQIYFSNQAEHAIVSETVKLCKRFGVSSATSLVNAVLRNSLRKIPKENLNNIEANKYDKAGFTKELYEHFLYELGDENEVNKLAKFLKGSPELNVRIRFNLEDTKSNQVKQVTKLLNEEEISIIPAYFQEDSLHLNLNGKSLHQSEAWKSGEIKAQGESAMLPAIALNPQAHENIADICAAPGGKTIQISDLSQGKAYILASDIQEHRIDLLNSELKRLGIQNVKTRIADASNIEQWRNYENYFDKVLLDVPCSGLGLLQSKPELRLSWSQEGIKELIEIQQKILNVASYILKPGGLMLYSTCTLNTAENSNQVNNFIKDNPNHSLVSMRDNLAEILDNLINLDSSLEQQVDKGEITLWPQKVMSEGFYLALIKKL